MSLLNRGVSIGIIVVTVSTSIGCSAILERNSITKSDIPHQSQENNNETKTNDTENTTPPTLIKSFDVIIPTSQQLCHTNDPWLLGVRKLTTADRLSQNQCFNLQFSANRHAELWLFTQSEDTEIIRLLPNNCSALGFTSNKISPHKNIGIPKPSVTRQSVFLLDNRQSTEWFYAIAVDNEQAKQQLQQATSTFKSICQAQAFDQASISPEQFKQKLDDIALQHPKHLQWAEQHFTHH